MFPTILTICEFFLKNIHKQKCKRFLFSSMFSMVVMTPKVLSHSGLPRTIQKGGKAHKTNFVALMFPPTKTVHFIVEVILLVERIETLNHQRFELEISFEAMETTEQTKSIWYARLYNPKCSNPKRN